MADEIERKIYETLGVDPPGSLSVVELPPDSDAEAEVPSRCGRGADAAGADATIPEEQAHSLPRDGLRLAASSVARVQSTRRFLLPSQARPSRGSWS